MFWLEDANQLVRSGSATHSSDYSGRSSVAGYKFCSCGASIANLNAGITTIIEQVELKLSQYGDHDDGGYCNRLGAVRLETKGWRPNSHGDNINVLFAYKAKEESV
jgi:hypothetical protein